MRPFCALQGLTRCPTGSSPAEFDPSPLPSFPSQQLELEADPLQYLEDSLPLSIEAPH